MQEKRHFRRSAEVCVLSFFIVYLLKVRKLLYDVLCDVLHELVSVVSVSVELDGL